MTVQSANRLPRILGRACAVVGALALTGQMHYEDADPGVNASIVREIDMSYACTLLSSGKPCGGETAIHTVQSDGTRTIRAFNDWASADSQINLVLRATADFTMVEGFAQVYSGNKVFGTGYYVVKDGAVQATVNGPEGYFTESTPLPEKYSLLLHPISADGWHFGQYDMKAGGEQTSQIYTLGGAGRSVLGAFFPVKLKFIGKEKITVPAGTFDTEHYKFGDNADVWTMGADRIMVRHEYTTNDTRFELSKLETKE